MEILARKKHMNLRKVLDDIQASKSLLTKIKEGYSDIVEYIVDIPYDIGILFQRFNHRTRKLIQFIKLGWNDYDFDHGYLTDLLVYKLNAMSKYHKESGHTEDADKMAKQMRVAAKALQKYTDFNHATDYDRRNPSKINSEHSWNRTESGLLSLKRVYTGTNLELSEEDIKIIREECRQSIRYEKRQLKRYKRIFFKLMYDNYLKWWD